MDEMNLGRIVVVDDEVELMTALCEMLAEQRYETRGFTSGSDALKAMKEKEFDLLLTDLMMPEMDGITLIKKALESDPEICSIIMTGHGTIQTAVDGMKSGAFDYILKPFKLSILLPVLSRALEMRRIRMENLQLRETVAIYDLSRAIAFTLDLKTILNKIIDGALQQCNADEASIMLPTQNGKELYVVAARGKDRETLVGQRIPIEEGISGWVARCREPLILHGEIHDPRFVPVKPRKDIFSALSLPMMVGGKLVGILNIHTTHRGRPFTLGQVKALNILTSTAASALENTWLYTQLQEAEQKYKSIFANANEAIFVVQDKKIVFANPKSLELSGYSLEEFISRPFIDFIHPEDQSMVIGNYLKRIGGEEVPPAYSYRIIDKAGQTKWVEPNIVSINWEGKPAALNFMTDITIRKQAEDKQRLFLKVLDLLNQTKEKSGLLRKILYLLKEETGIEAIGIRLREGEDFPYYETRGFSETFVEEERVLCARDENGEIIRDSQGDPSLECMCGNVLCQRTDPSLPFFTEGGSFWTNSTSELLALTTEKDRQAWTRNRCSGEGYESVALVPLRSGDEIIGLLQMNDRKPNQFSLDKIKLFEGIGASIGIALARKQMVVELQKSEEKYRGIFENALEGIFQTTPEGQFISVNPAMVRMHGFASPEEMKTSITDTGLQVFIDPEDRIRYRNLLVEQGAVKGFEVQMVKKDGAKIWVSITAYAVKDKEGKILCFEGLTQDITERKQGEAERERLLLAIEQTKEMIVITDAGGTIQYVNPAFETVTGYTREEALGQTPRLLKSGKQDQAFYHTLWETISSGGTWEGRIVNKRKDGKLFTEETTISPVYDASGRIINYVAVKRDMTEHLQLTDQFLQAQKMESIGRLAGGVAHDFNNLLTTIIGNAQLALMDMGKDHTLYGILKEILGVGEKAAVLTRQLLAFSRKQILKPEVINLNEVLPDLEKILRRLIGEHIDLKTILAPDLGLVEIDGGQFEQVILNLAVNARDAMPGGGKLTIESLNTDLDEEYASGHIAVTPGPYVLLSISDTGEGMTPEVQAHIFEPFFTTKEKGKGTGLGLPMAYGIVKQSRGCIWVYSEVGQGTTVKIYLPRVDKETAGVKKNRIIGEVLGGSETVLVVEDDENLRNLAVKVLNKYGYTVLAAGDGPEALDLFKKADCPIHLLVTDVVLPGMNGKELAERLEGFNPEMKVLFMSGYTDNAIVHHGILDEGIAFIEKPFTLEDLGRKVREVLEA